MNIKDFEERLCEAHELEASIHNRQKYKSFEKIFEQQESSIRYEMKDGAKSAVWYFGTQWYMDDDGNENQFEKSCKDEFNEIATKLFESKGYTVKGKKIYW